MMRFGVEVPAAEGLRRYPVIVGSRALDELPRILSRPGGPSRLHVVSDRRVWARWGRRIGAVLSKAQLPWASSVVPAGERSKSARTLAKLWRDLVQAGCDRRSWVLAFGGGMVGDLAGFAAASALRGIEFIQVPTTLLAMVDASVGGKTGINLPEGKNLVGAFHQPRAVVMDLDLLRTLPPREMRSGWAEVIKTAAICDARLFASIEARRAALLARDPESLARVVAACARIKAGVVRRDEREAGLRMILNFGHTLAHALEAARGYGGLLHGEAVAIGMVFAARLGELAGASRHGTAERLERLIDAFGLPTRLPKVPWRPLLDAMKRDKKRGPAGLRWVLLRRLGAAQVSDAVGWSAAEAALESFAGAGRPERA